jgi:hypothetical protein
MFDLSTLSNEVLALHRTERADRAEGAKTNALGTIDELRAYIIKDATVGASVDEMSGTVAGLCRYIVDEARAAREAEAEVARIDSEIAVRASRVSPWAGAEQHPHGGK